MNKQKLIQQLVDQVDSLPNRDRVALDSLRQRSEMYIRNIFGESNKYLSDLKNIRFTPMVYPASESRFNESWSSGVSKLKNLYLTIGEELALFDSGPTTPEVEEISNIHKRQHSNTKVFIVHGHNEAVKNEAARFIESLKLEPIILHERPNSGKTIIEKFEHESSDVGFALVLLTGDDQGLKIGGHEDLKPRARQNVILELGYFLGEMGRAKVAALVENGVEIPSDYSGVIYIPFDSAGAWKLSLARELKTAGLKVDLNLAM